MLSAFSLIPRHLFVSPPYRSEAYLNYPLPLPSFQSTSQPSLIAFILQTLKIKASQKILEIGTGSGYQSALLSCLCQKVYTIEIIPILQQKAVKIFRKLHLKNIFSRLADGKLGWPKKSPFDAIIVSAASTKIPPDLTSQLKIGGKLIIPLGQNTQILTLVTKTKTGALRLKQLKAVTFVPLK